MTDLPPTIEHGPLAGYLRPPQTNGAEHYDVDLRGVPAGRVTRRAAPHNERPTPGWYVWCGWYSAVGGGYVLRDAGNNVIYYPEPQAAIAGLFGAIFPDAERSDEQ